MKKKLQSLKLSSFNGESLKILQKDLCYYTPSFPDDNAFQKCDICEEMVVITLADTHECGTKKKKLKRLRALLELKMLSNR